MARLGHGKDRGSRRRDHGGEPWLGAGRGSGDGLPVLGPVPGVAGLWLAVLHSGVTLAPLAGELLAAEMLGRGDQALLAGFRPARLM